MDETFFSGRPAKYDTAFELQEEIERYFKEGVKTKTYVLGPPNARYEVTIEVPTITGLCRFLGFESRQSFYDYEKRDGFSYTIKRARLFIEQHYEEMLQTGNIVGAIFALKNFDWTDKQILDHTTRGKEIQQFILELPADTLQLPANGHSSGNGHDK